MREWRLRSLLMGLLLTTIVTTFGLVAIAILTYRLPQIEAASREQARMHAVSLMRQAEQSMQGLETRLHTAAAQLPGRLPVEQQMVLDATLSGGGFDALYLVRPNGQIGSAALIGRPQKGLQQGLDLANDAIFRETRVQHRSFWSERYQSPVSEQYVMAMALPVGDSLLVGESSPRNLSRMVESAALNIEQPVLIIDRRGEWIAETRLNEEDRLLNWKELAERWQTGGIASGERLRLVGEMSHIGVAHSDKLGWNFLVAQPAGMANSRYAVTMWLVLGGLLGAILFSALLAPLWARLIVRPVQEMAGQMKEMIAGNYWKQVPRGHVAELNQFAANLEQMAEVILLRQRDAERSQERLRATLENSPSVAVQWFGSDGVVRYWNHASEQLYGYSAEEALGKPLDQLILPPEDFALFLDVLRQVRHTGEAAGPQETTTYHRDGRQVVVLSTIFAIPGDDGERQFVCMDVDITASQAATRALKASEQRFQSIFVASPLPMAVLVTEPGICGPQSGCRIMEVNESWLSKFGRQREDVLGRGLSEIGLWPDGEGCKHCVTKMLEHRPGGMAETWLLRADGAPVLCEMSVQPVAVDAQNILIWVLNDITDKRVFEEELRQLNLELEARVGRRTEDLAKANAELKSVLENLQLAQGELVRAEKLAALGGVVAGVAHELNTPIGNGLMAVSTLGSQLHLFQNGMADGLRRSTLDAFVRDVDTAVSIAQRNLERAADLVASFKQVAVDQTSSQRRRFDLREVINEILVTLHPMLKRTPYQVSLDVPEGIVLDSYPGPLGQVLTNLIGNSVLHAFAGREQGTIRIVAEAPQQGRVRLRVSDDGCGIADSVRDRIFEPFVTTRRGNGGTGLGLHISYNAVTSLLSGQISVNSQPGSGSEFVLHLPLVAPFTEEANNA